MLRFTAFALVLCMGSQAFASDPVATRTLSVGTILSEADIRRAQDAHSVGVPTELVGKEVRRTIYAGRPISLSDLGPPTVVRRNEVVTMVFRSGQMGLRTQGRSLGSAGVGEVVEIMNLDSKLKVRGVVVGAARVEVTR